MKDHNLEKPSISFVSRNNNFEVPRVPLNLLNIEIASDNDPERPEFPPENPNFPASKTFKIEVPGLENVYLKDESTNPTGTHKDRMAWEIVVAYKFMVETVPAEGQLPQMSIISSGSAALAIQMMLQKYGLPNLKVLVDMTIDVDQKQKLERIGCEVFQADLSQKELGPVDILAMTNNSIGFDITSNVAFKPSSQFYDWLSYEIINNNADYYFIPFGTGALYENLIHTCTQIRTQTEPDKRFMVSADSYRMPHLLGATTSNPGTLMNKLYSPFLPFKSFDNQALGLLKQMGVVGEHSHIYPVQEKYVAPAMSIVTHNEIQAEPSAISGLALLLQMQDLGTCPILPSEKIVIVSTGKTKWSVDEQ